MVFLIFQTVTRAWTPGAIRWSRSTLLCCGRNFARPLNGPGASRMRSANLGRGASRWTRYRCSGRRSRARFITCLTTGSNIRCATAFRSCGFPGWALRIVSRMRRRSGSIARDLRRRGRSRACFLNSTVFCPAGAISLGADRSWMRPLSRCRAITIPAMRTGPSGTARSRRTGPAHPPNDRGRTPMPAGPGSTGSRITVTGTT